VYKGLTEFPSWIRNAHSLRQLILIGSSVTCIPDWIGDLQSLTELELDSNENLAALPDSIGNLKSLVKLDLSGLPIENLPDTIVNCTSLEYINIRGTNIAQVPKTISGVKKILQSVKHIPKDTSVSYRTFCNCYYNLAETIIAFSDKARREGLLALEEKLAYYPEDLFKTGIRLVVDGTDCEIIRHVMSLKIEREHDYYRKKLMEIAMEGVLMIQNHDSLMYIVFTLAALADIKNNPLDAACVKYLAGDYDALDNIDFTAALQTEDEREEIRFIKRIMFLAETARQEGILALDKHLDSGGIAAKDVLEYGLPFVIDGWDFEKVDKILTMLISYETDPVRKNLALAKKDALRMLCGGDNPRVILTTLSAYFDASITKEFLNDKNIL
jgi:flagellar motor component MotA